MADWKSLVDSFFRKADPQNSFQHIVNAGASPDSISAAESQIGFPISDELRSFYLCVNGIGLGWGAEPNMPRFIGPVQNLPAFVAQARSAFADTHHDFASRFFAFVDWENGDVTGYLRQEDGAFYPFLVTFMHEKYRFEATQDVNDFMEEGPESLAELLSGWSA